MITKPHFEDKTALIDWLIENKTALIAQKKSVVKNADAISYSSSLVNEKGDIVKADNAAVSASATRIKVRAVINTTKLFDSHEDVHFDQLWNKSLKDNKENYLCNQHNFSFEGIISDNVHAFAKQMTWKELNYHYEGSTQALIFDTVIDKAESPFMFEKYRTGKVKQHSVGMRYVKIELCVDDTRYEKEKANWDKYYPQVANKEDVNGYFWAVLEAKVVEGSAVVKGSNWVTPTQSVSETKDSQPSSDTGTGAAKRTPILGALNNLLKTLER